jgi:hypothetical protein
LQRVTTETAHVRHGHSETFEETTLEERIDLNVQGVFVATQ